MGEQNTGGGVGIGGNVETGGGGFVGRDSQKNDIRIEAGTPDYRTTSLETKLAILEGRLADFSRATDRSLDALRDELRTEMAEQNKERQPPTWHYWLAIVSAAVAIVMLWMFIQRLDIAITLLERLPKTP